MFMQWAIGLYGTKLGIIQRTQTYRPYVTANRKIRINATGKN